MDMLGNTYDTSYFSKAAGRLDSKFARRFDSRLNKLFEGEGTFQIEKSGNGDSFNATRFPFGDMQTITDDAIRKDFITYYGQKLSRNDANIQSPAAFRAFLLAISAENNKVQTGICGDHWNNKPLTSIPAYSLFTALYTLTKENASLSSLGKVASIVDSNGLRFQQKGASEDLIGQLASFCSNGFVDPKDKSIVATAYRKLQELYIVQLQRVSEFLQQKLFLSDSKFATSLAAGVPDAPILHLHPSFVKNTAPAIDTLHQYMQEAKTLLSTHYAEVETVYNTALQNIVNRQKGLQAIPTPKTGGKHTRRRSQHRRHSSFRKKRVARR